MQRATGEGDVADQATCGLGLAEHSPLPARMAELIACVAENLEVHMGALDLEDERSKREREVYARLLAAHLEIAARLRAVSEDMAGSRDLPMGRHDEAAMSSPAVVNAFERLVAVERQLLESLRSRVEEHRTMLAEVGDAPDPGGTAKLRE